MLTINVNLADLLSDLLRWWAPSQRKDRKQTKRLTKLQSQCEHAFFDHGVRPIWCEYCYILQHDYDLEQHFKQAGIK